MAATIGVLHRTAVTAGVATKVSLTDLFVSSALIQVKGGDNGATGANTGKVFFGTSTVTASGETGVQLPAPSAAVSAPSLRVDSADSSNLINLADLYFATAVNGEGIVVLYYLRT